MDLWKISGNKKTKSNTPKAEKIELKKNKPNQISS